MSDPLRPGSHSPFLHALDVSMARTIASESYLSVSSALFELSPVENVHLQQTEYTLQTIRKAESVPLDK